MQCGCQQSVDLFEEKMTFEVMFSGPFWTSPMPELTKDETEQTEEKE